MRESANFPASKLPNLANAHNDNDFRHSFQWRMFRIMAEFVDGWQFLADFSKTVTFFGSARCKKGELWYDEAEKLGKLLAKEGYSIITGGGPGIMEAGNRGAIDAKKEAKKNAQIGESIGLNIQLPHEQRTNRFVSKFVAFHYFFIRKVMLSYYAQAYVYFPGGYGTLDEMFELLTLVQTNKVPKIPIVLVGKKFWQPLDAWIRKVMYTETKAVDKSDMNIYRIVDNAKEAFDIIIKSPERKEF
jgi:uncharacterized protein (TIGR00730 family)